MSSEWQNADVGWLAVGERHARALPDLEGLDPTVDVVSTETYAIHDDGCGVWDGNECNCEVQEVVGYDDKGFWYHFQVVTRFGGLATVDQDGAAICKALSHLTTGDQPSDRDTTGLDTHPLVGKRGSRRSRRSPAGGRRWRP